VTSELAPPAALDLHPRARDYSLLLLGAAVLSVSPILFTLSRAAPAPGAFWRFAYGFPAIALVCALRPGARASFRLRGWAGLAALAGALLAADILCWHSAIPLLGAGPATLLANTQVIWVALFGALALAEHPTALFWLGLPVLFGGLWLLAGGAASAPLEADRSGLGYGLLAGVLYAGSLVCLRRAQRVAPAAAEAVLAVEVATSLAVVAVAGWLDGSLPVSLSDEQHAWLLALGLGPQVCGWFAITRALRRLPGHHGAVLLLLQPVGSYALGWLLLGQALDPARLLGGALVLAAIAAAIFAEARGGRG
jgi:drug/metabolite transporter (DMT)-like permease